MDELNSYKGELILIVDDNPQNLKVLGSTLKQDGYNIAISTSGKNCLEFLKSQMPALILLDVMMPEMDGYETCKRIKVNENTKTIPVIFLTAKTDTEDIVTGFNAGAIDYIKKPFIMEELLARVKSQINLHKANKEIKALTGMIPICASCKKMKNSKGYWEQVETYLESITDLIFTHGLCESCLEELYPDIYKKMKNKDKI